MSQQHTQTLQLSISACFAFYAPVHNYEMHDALIGTHTSMLEVPSSLSGMIASINSCAGCATPAGLCARVREACQILN
jgi:hypothetical protein